MEPFVFVIVLLAALFHATWNTFAKVDSDRLIFMAVLLSASGIAALVTTPFLPFPKAEVWPVIALSVLVHVGYTVFLIMAYRYGDLSHVYPLARGSAPLIVALASVPVLGETLSNQALLAILLMAAGIISLSLTRKEQGLRDPWAVFFALGTGFFIAAYTLTDAVGARMSDAPHSYAAWMLGLEWIPVALYVWWTRQGKLVGQVKSVCKKAVPLGLVSLAAYWCIIWAMTVAPAAMVATLRETSIVIAMLFGVFFLKEKLNLYRWASAFTMMLGVLLLKLNR